MTYNHYIENGFKLVGKIVKTDSSKKKHKTDVEWLEGFNADGKMGVYIMTSDENIMKIGESQNLRHRFQCYESHTGPTNKMVRENMEYQKEYGILFLECPSFEVGFGGVKVPSGINYRFLEKKLIEQYRDNVGSLPVWNKGVQ